MRTHYQHFCASAWLINEASAPRDPEQEKHLERMGGWMDLPHLVLQTNIKP